VNADRVRAFMRACGAAARREGVCYLTGGATAVLLGWRDSTLDIDVRFEPEEEDEVMRALQRLKHDLQMNIETASPDDFIPVPAGWEARSAFAGREGALTFRHFDFYSQALSKLERGHDKDLIDVAALLERELVAPGTLLEMYEEIESQLHRFPAIDPASFRRRVERAISRAHG
jgi:hypothetical protein